jgi:hypothetical protein
MDDRAGFRKILTADSYSGQARQTARQNQRNRTNASNVSQNILVSNSKSILPAKAQSGMYNHAD